MFPSGGVGLALELAAGAGAFVEAFAGALTPLASLAVTLGVALTGVSTTLAVLT